MATTSEIANLNIPPEYAVLSIPGTSVSVNYEGGYFPSPYSATEIEIHPGECISPVFINKGLFKDINTGLVDVLVLIKKH